MKIYMLLSICIFLASPAYAADTTNSQSNLPAAITKQIAGNLQPVGSGKYKKLGFTIYNATLFAPQANWQAAKPYPYALQLKYARSLSKETLLDALMENISDQKTADAKTLKRWKGLLKQYLPAVKEGDVLVALSNPKKNSEIYFNGTKIGDIPEKPLSDAFFGIWLGKTADSELKSKLLGGGR